MSKIDDFYSDLPKGRCNPCQHARCVVATGQYMFLGCYHAPYKGKCVSEIKYCPKVGGEQE